MIDENAYGLLISYFGIEDDEYGLERDEFVQRVQDFHAHVRAHLAEVELDASARALNFGHAVYVELAEDELPFDPLAWIREMRRRLTEDEFESVGVLTYGGRWLHLDDAPAPSEASGVHEISLPSEPLRHALDADAASRQTEDDEEIGWGPGLYVENEAIEALGRKLKNEPTALEVGGARFFRIGR